MRELREEPKVEQDLNYTLTTMLDEDLIMLVRSIQSEDTVSGAVVVTPLSDRALSSGLVGLHFSTRRSTARKGSAIKCIHQKLRLLATRCLLKAPLVLRMLAS